MLVHAQGDSWTRYVPMQQLVSLATQVTFPDAGPGDCSAHRYAQKVRRVDGIERLRNTPRMSGTMPGDDGVGDTRGWDRASIAHHTRKPYRPNINQKDLLLPNEPGALRSLWVCSVCAFSMTVLYIYLPLFMVNIYVSLMSAAWFAAVFCGSFLGLVVVLFVLSGHETRQLRRLAREL